MAIAPSDRGDGAGKGSGSPSLGRLRLRRRRRATRSFLVVGPARTGSNYLCRALAMTQRLGYPTELFHEDFEARLCERWGIERPGPGHYGDFVEAALRAQSTSNGVFGAKVLWPHERLLLERLGVTGARSGPQVVAALADAFPDLHLVHLERLDKVRAAVSHWRAQETGQWLRRSYEIRAPLKADADIEAISRLHDEQHEAEDFWSAALVGGSPSIRVDYEDLVADRDGAVRRVAALLGIDSVPWRPEAVSRAVLPVRQADAANDRVVAYWNAATGGCDRCREARAR
jgi:LPS sulfotransferase NodH